MKNSGNAKAETPTKRVAVVGAGVAGLYSAWRVAKDSSTSVQVDLFELDSEVGGRVRSVALPGIPFRAELGAMRFRLRHQLLKSLVDELEIPTVPFEFDPPVYYVRGRRLSSTELATGRCESCCAPTPFNLRPGELQHSPTGLVKLAIGKVLRGLDFPGLHAGRAKRLKEEIRSEAISRKSWEIIKVFGSYQGLFLHQIGFWNLLQHSLSNEAFVLVHDVLSLESILGNWNAAEAIPWFLDDFSSDAFEMIPGGMSLVSIGLEKAATAAGVNLRQSTRVSEIAYLPEELCWRVVYAPEGSDAVAETYDSVILALPKLALSAIQVRGIDWPPPWIGWVRGHRMFKMFLLYDNEWWQGDRLPGHATGRVFTDLPLRQIYYFSPTWMDTHGARDEKRPADGRANGDLSLVMASYSDEHYVSFWEPLVASHIDSGPKAISRYPYLNPSESVPDEVWNRLTKVPSRYLASKRMVEKVQRLLAEIHDREDVPVPLVGLFRDWGEFPFGGGWHTWEVGARPWDIQKEKVTLGPGLYLCGEAYSNEQGWIEGALKSAELVVRELQVPPPEWTKARIQNFPDYISG